MLYAALLLIYLFSRVHHPQYGSRLDKHCPHVVCCYVIIYLFSRVHHPQYGSRLDKHCPHVVCCSQLWIFILATYKILQNYFSCQNCILITTHYNLPFIKFEKCLLHIRTPSSLLTGIKWSNLQMKIFTLRCHLPAMKHKKTVANISQWKTRVMWPKNWHWFFRLLGVICGFSINIRIQSLFKSQTVFTK